MGIDAGMESVNIVIMHDNRLIYDDTIFIGTQDIGQIVTKMIQGALKRLGISRNEIRFIGGTGINASEISLIQDEISEGTCLALGMEWVSSKASTVLDVGASKFTAIKCKHGRVLRIAKSDKCASGVGISLRMLANVLAKKMDEIGQMSLGSIENVTIQSTCSVFMETEIISLLHHYKNKPEDILRGVFRGMASRFYSLLLHVGIEDDLFMIGGVANNQGIVRALQEVSGYKVDVPQYPYIIGALGAALAITGQGEL